MSYVALSVFPLLMAFAAFSDLFTMRLSNGLALMVVIAFFAAALIAGLPFETIGMHVLAALLVLAIAFGLFAAGWVGGGDAKLVAAITLWLGFGLTLPYLVYASILGGILTLNILLLRRLPLNPYFARWRWLERLHDAREGVPYGIALAIAAVVLYAQTPVFKALTA
ncbi:prepilin peptidase CpaA [Devosia enhydra]|uniref:Prepilin peptidase CpaA n=1 Tax=Devosia enhydra TaxID=665118 RepID=A0A1K2I227_9HYPH|nr:prepilin peptidase [Devosia enhydra]SFZ86437.1 prepilin peptidase CpaA [Devosia enhydra]